jgi:hypothetical protein
MLASTTRTCVFALLSLALIACSAAETPLAGGEQKPNQDAGGGGGDKRAPSDEKPPLPEEPPTDFFGLWPKTIHTGFAPGGTYKVPVSVRYFDVESGKEPTASDWTWEIADASVASIVPIEGAANNERPGEVFAIVTVKKAGATKCAGCHELSNGVDHSPTWLAFYADADVLAAVTTGKYADGRVLKGVNHKWELTDAEKTGILAYLRSIPPKGF